MAHEEPAGQVVRMVIGFGNPAVISRQQVADLGHNPYPVGAGGYQSKGTHLVDSRYPNALFHCAPRRVTAPTVTTRRRWRESRPGDTAPNPRHSTPDMRTFQPTPRFISACSQSDSMSSSRYIIIRLIQ